MWMTATGAPVHHQLSVPSDLPNRSKALTVLPVQPQDKPMRSKRGHRKTTPPPQSTAAAVTPSAASGAPIAPNSHSAQPDQQGYFDVAATPQSTAIATPGPSIQPAPSSQITSAPSAEPTAPAVEQTIPAAQTNGQHESAPLPMLEENGEVGAELRREEAEAKLDERPAEANGDAAAEQVDATAAGGFTSVNR